MNFKNKNIIFVAISLVVFILLAVAYANPIISGKQLLQHDIVQYKGGAKELLDYRANNEQETYWSDSMFGGMPTYQTGAQFRGDVIKKIDDVFNFLPKPANFIFLFFAGFFLLGYVVTKNWKYALLGATFFGLSTYFYIIIAAGHNGKAATLVYFAPLLAGILLVYIRKKYILGFIVTSLFMGLQICANHPQMTYYLFLALAFLFISELVRAAKGKTEWKHFFISSGILGLAMILGVGMNSQRLLANSEYVKETVRGKQILKSAHNSKDDDGMKKQEILNWSYGKTETLNLFIPRLLGGSSTEEVSDEFKKELRTSLENQTNDEEQIQGVFGQVVNGVPMYWGDQPGTSGPAYQGAVVIFLAILGFFFANRKYRYWILGASILSILLAWGSNFLPLSDIFIDYVPLYNKFRAPSSILVVVELLFPLIAIIGLYRFYNDDSSELMTKAYKQKILLYVGGGVLGFTLLIILFAKSLFGFENSSETGKIPDFIMTVIKDERARMLRIDAIKAFIYVLITFGVLFLSLKKKLSQNIALVIIGLVSLLDLWTVDKRYLNNDNFVDKTLAQEPYVTENNEYLASKAGNNTFLLDLLSRANMNKALQEIADKDKNHYRIFNQILGPFGETNTSYFKSSVGGYHAVKLRRYDDLINHYFYAEDSTKSAQIPNILSLLNTKYVVGGTVEQPQIQINPKANGNAWFVSDIKFVNSPNEEIDEIGSIDTKKTAVISSDDKKYFEGKTIAADSTAFLDLTKYQANELEFKTQSKTPQLAVLSEIYYPKGWKMFVDEKEVPYIKADYLLRAVYVPAGNHTIKMLFEPEVITKGKTISMIAFGLFVLLSLLGIFWLYRKYEGTSRDLSEISMKFQNS
ncbi:YfhO family protein [Cloacibacterium sp.]|uniref:YfhO family protein n=1 Tax=Cloacibacterium sp. TaxID=1913682 RepID=UPI0039E56AD6